MSRPEAKIIADSINTNGNRLTTMEVRFHRFVLAEMNTHRVFTRNSASSRAIPVKKLLDLVMNDPAMPMFWGKNQAGMGAAVELEETPKKVAIGQWLLARDQAVQTVKMLSDLGVHKQLANRLIEPWLWHKAIISSTELDNFFAQRLAINPETKQPYAQPEMFYAALAMYDAYRKSTPKDTRLGFWHLPYIQNEDWQTAIQYAVTNELNTYDVLKKVSAGRCARVSYLTHDGKRDILEDIKLAEKLASSNPMHPSPFEHVATPYAESDTWRPGNFRGWFQMRHEFSNESVNTFTVDPEALDHLVEHTEE